MLLSFADDNHQVLSLRLAFRSRNNDTFPASTTEELLESYHKSRDAAIKNVLANLVKYLPDLYK